LQRTSRKQGVPYLEYPVSESRHHIKILHSEPMRSSSWSSILQERNA
jgi:hypothetical protein